MKRPLGELALMRVKHEAARMSEFELEHVALALTEHHRIGEIIGLECGPGAEDMKEVGVQMERVDQVKLEHVHDVQPDPLADHGW
jgi:hypothetical protein